jgi:metal-sulfur cluster biosynthetic enzyme
MRSKLAVFILLTSAFCPAEEITPKVKVVNKSLEVIGTIEKAASVSKTVSDKEVMKTVDEALKDINDPDQLVKIAQLSWTLAWPQEAGDARIDTFFDTTFWKCVEKISGIKGPRGAYALGKIDGFIKNDAGGSLRFRDYVSLQSGAKSK